MRSITSTVCAAIFLTSSLALADAVPPPNDAGTADAATPSQDAGSKGTTSDAGSVAPDLSACVTDESKVEGGGIDCASSPLAVGVGTSGIGLLLFVPLLLRRRRRH